MKIQFKYRSIIAILLSFIMLSSLFGCGMEKASDEPLPQPGEPVPRYTITRSNNASVLYKSFRDDDCNYYLYYLGSINRVPLQDNVDVYQFSGVPYEKEFTTTVSASTAISQMISFSENSSVKVENCTDISGTFGGDAIGAAIDFGLSQSTSQENSLSKTRSFETAVTYSVEHSDTTKFAFVEETPHGYYRYMLFGDVDVYGVLIKDRASEKYYTSTYEVIASQYYDLDYSENSRFDDNQYEKLVFDTKNIDIQSLPIPTNHFITKVEYDSGFSPKEIDASDEYTFDVFDISELSMFFNSNYTLQFHVEVYMKEDYAGYQEIFLCKDNESHVAGVSAYEYGGSGDANKSYGWVNFDWNVDGKNCTEIMKLRYGANGKHSDDWWRGHAKVTVTVEKNWLSV